jgi:hypothetical protein
LDLGSEEEEAVRLFGNGKQTIQFEEFINEILSCSLNEDVYETCLMHAFSLFDTKM